MSSILWTKCVHGVLYFLLAQLLIHLISAQLHEFPTATVSTSWVINSTEDFSSYFDGSMVNVILRRGASRPQFGCGFFCNGICDTYLFAIFYLDDNFVDTCLQVVWSANRNYPVRMKATLQLTSHGDLVLENDDGSIVWSTNTSGKSVAGLNLTDTGNLLLFDHKNATVWQSFDHPTDCLVPGQKLMAGQKLTPSVSLTNWTELGFFSVSVSADRGLFASVMFNPPQVYYQFVGHYMDMDEPKYVRYLNGSLGLFDYSGSSQPDDLDLIPTNASSAQYTRFGSDGHLRAYEWRTGGWTEVVDLFTEGYGECSYPAVCGSSSVFVKLQNVTKMHNVSTEVPQGKKRSQMPMLLMSILGSFVGVIILIGILIILFHGSLMLFLKKRNADEAEEDCLDQVPGMLTRFSFQDLKVMTGNFSKLLGKGGFGSVFEGTLVDGTKIAVKQLNGFDQKVRKSFITEVEAIGGIHHLNLVQLIGFCAEKFHRLLVYEYMSNRSLDKWIFNKTPEFVLDWQQRKKIILDVAKGLTYLHEDCRQKIIHLDIKPQNIRLDDKFNAKISDFGLSKLIDRDQSKVVTTMRGTPGYLAPEWLKPAITEKVDIYSLGVVILEILCGRRNFDRSQPEERENLLSLFEKKAEEDQLLDLIDDQISEDMQIHGAEILTIMNVAAWCLQSNYAKRPSMSVVVNVLEGVIEVENNLDYNLSNPTLRRTSPDVTPLLPSVLSGPR